VGRGIAYGDFLGFPDTCPGTRKIVETGSSRFDSDPFSIRFRLNIAVESLQKRLATTKPLQRLGNSICDCPAVNGEKQDFRSAGFNRRRRRKGEALRTAPFSPFHGEKMPAGR
jgi:hypothetical protein